MQSALIHGRPLFVQVIIHAVAAVGKSEPLLHQHPGHVAPIDVATGHNAPISILIQSFTRGDLPLESCPGFLAHPVTAGPNRTVVACTVLVGFRCIDTKKADGFTAHLDRVAVNDLNNPFGPGKRRMDHQKVERDQNKP